MIQIVVKDLACNYLFLGNSTQRDFLKDIKRLSKSFKAWHFSLKLLTLSFRLTDMFLYCNTQR